MRWPIRNQILMPLLGIQITVAIAVFALSAAWSLRQIHHQVNSRLNELTSLIQSASYPLTPAVLKQVRGFSGAEFVLLDRDRRVLAATRDPLEDVSSANRVDALPAAPGERVSVVWDGHEYVAQSTRIQHLGADANLVTLYPADLIAIARWEAVRGALLNGGLMFVLTTLAGMFVASRIGLRIQHIERQVARVAAGDFSPIPLPRRRDELRDLSASVNAMAGDLDRLTAQIRETERALMVRRLAGGIAHQLRNSITGARMAIQVHGRRCQASGDESLQVALRQLAITEEQIRGLVALIRDQERQPLPGKLSEIAEEVSQLIQPICQHRRIQLAASEYSGTALVGDAEQVRAAFLNLCMNAIEATASGGHVRTRVWETGDNYVLEVRDDGPGVSKDLADSLYEPFRTGKADGLGLGLSLVKQASIDQHGEIIHFRDENWTVFRLTCRQAPAAESPRNGKASVTSDRASHEEDAGLPVQMAELS